MKFRSRNKFIIWSVIVVSMALLVCNAVFSSKKDEPEQLYKASVVKSLYKVFPQNLRQMPLEQSVDISLAKNEYESFQILFYDVKDNLEGIKVNFPEFKDQSKGVILNDLSITVREAGYVPTKKPYYNTEHVGLWPDPLLEADDFAVKKEEFLLLWISIYAGPKCPAGDYNGYIEISPKGALSKKIPVNLHVWDFTLKNGSNLKTAFDLSKYFVRKFHTRKRGESYLQWEQRMDDTYHAYCKSMLSYRISPILNIEPDSSDFSEHIRQYSNLGITAFGIGPYGGSFGNKWPKEDNKVVSLYGNYANALRREGLLDKSYIYTWDEGQIGNPEVKRISKLIHEADSGLKNMVCYHGFWDPEKHPGWGDDIDIWCFQIASFDERLRNELDARGKEIWMYISGPGNVYPNFAMDFPAQSARIIPWLCFKYDFKGLLYWAVNFWNVNPYKDAMNTDWQQNGNGVLFYPGIDGPVASLRLELIRDGMEDYEYLFLLKSLYESKKNSISDTGLKNEIENILSLKGFISSLKKYETDPDKLLNMREKIAQMIVHLL
ncbi:MAG: glycoside hydrolase domain-containing protein [Candidatus Omnitrophota bacterium]